MGISRVRSATIHVSDQDKALDFYVNILGFEKRQDERFGLDFRWLTVAPPGEQTELVLAHGYGAWELERVGKFTGIVLGADDIQATYETLKAEGVQFIEAPAAQAWGMMQAIFADADGNQYVLVGPAAADVAGDAEQ